MRAELLSRDQMRQHGRALAGTHKITKNRVPERLLARLTENEHVLSETCNLLTSAVKANRRIAPAGEWLLDNFYLIKEQVHTAKKHLPKGYSRELPRLATGPSAGLPRVYDIALETISHGDGHVDQGSLSSFIAAYQEVTALKMGELWAIPIMLRLALIENLRRVGSRIATERLDRNLADKWAEQMMEAAENDPKSLITVIADMARSTPPMTSPFVAELTRRLLGKGPALSLPLTWIEQWLSESGLTIEQFVQSEAQHQASDQVSISNSIGSLRLLGAIDWQEFVETRSSIEQILREDPTGDYPRMDFATRDRYRHVIEKIAKNSLNSEEDVALNAIRLAQDSAEKNGDDRSAHVGFYLIDKGLPQLEGLAQMSLSSYESLLRIGCRFPLTIYLGSIFLITAILTGSLLAKAYAAGIHGWVLTLIAILLVLGTSHLACALVNWVATLLVTPHKLPRMDFSKGVPPESRTLVVIPTMITNASNIESLFDALEVRFLANSDDNLYFSLLTDFTDAIKETLPEDEELLQLARQKIEDLNEKYHGTQGDMFFLFHRPRLWNPQERIWMGYERKRGKLSDLNSLLRGNAKDRFSLIVGNTAQLLKVKYVITLDTDTDLPRESARQFAAVMAHPLNRPIFDKEMQRVSQGYGIIQPRIAISLPSSNRSWYARLFGNEPGIDPYTRVVSDIYQDVFGEGSFIGKGIYDVDAFELALHDRFPENKILSHDLIEGCYARSGLLSDVLLYEEYPSCHAEDVKRRYRWIRGDWQLARWLFSSVPVKGGHNEKNPISGLSQWKILDNLRRSLEPLALTLLLLLSWTLLSPAWFWTVSITGILLLQSLFASIFEMYRKPQDVLLSQHLSASVRSAGQSLTQAMFRLTCLPYEACFSLDAVLRTTWRLLISRRRLLEWNPSGSTNNRMNLLGLYLRMWFPPCIAFAAIIYLVIFKPLSLLYAWPILGLWLASPAVSWGISRPLARRQAQLSINQIIFLRKISRKTWAFFETFVGPEDNWLPPDSYQENRPVQITHRTSPTNMGLSLIANLTAYDFGYIPLGKFIDRTANAIRTMEALERYQGHFYNWYDTLTLKPLPPLYISSVDSGNLGAHLMALRSGLLELPEKKIVSSQLFEGLSDTLRVFMDSEGQDSAALLTVVFQNTLALATLSPPATLPAVSLILKKLTTLSEEIARTFASGPESEAKWWALLMALQCRSALDELTFLAPWTALNGFPERLSDFKFAGEIPTLAQLAKLDYELWPLFHNPSVENETPEVKGWLNKLREHILKASNRAKERIASLERLSSQLNELAHMEYGFLYDKRRHLLSIGYNIVDERLDSSFYDLLASEARLACFVAISQGQLPQESWFALGRLLTNVGGDPVLLSWDGSMFEYLMPLLVMPTYENTLLDQTYKAAVNRQISYGMHHGVPWGISESGYNMVDVHLNYQYRAFGVPGLGLRRGLAEDLVIAPYASALALMVEPEAACLNLEQLSEQGFAGKFGFFEAIDYTPSRQMRGQLNAVVRSFMAHHQGMSLLAFASVLLNRPMQQRFQSDPLVKSTILLLQERVPKDMAFYSHTSELSDLRTAHVSMETPVRVFSTAETPVPEVQLLSNSRYNVMVTNSGGGCSRWKDIAVTRWREDATSDNWGTFSYIRDMENSDFWSGAYQPTLKQPKLYEVIFSEGRAEFRRRDNDIDMHTEIAVSPEDDIELRRTRITNRSRRQRTLEVTSYAEVVLAPAASDALHPVFSNLFVQTEILQQRKAILCTRRPRSRDEHSPWMFHLMAVHGAKTGEVSYETDRMRFIGRGNTLVNPQAMTGVTPLSGTDGSVLDPIVSIRRRIILDPGRSATIDMVWGIGETRDTALGLVEKYQDRRLSDRVFELAWTHSQVILQQLNITEADAQLYGILAGSIIYANSSLRADPGVLIKNNRGQSGLWGYAISGDLPIVLLKIKDSSNIELVRQLVQAHAYWRLKGVSVDLVIWNEDHATYRQLLHDQIMGLIAAGIEVNITDRPGGIFVRVAEQISSEDRILIQTVARAIITDSRGTLAEQLNKRGSAEIVLPNLNPTRALSPEPKAVAALPRHDLNFFNGIGGFTPDGKEYVITTAQDQVTPAPWVNVLANPNFGAIVSESGPNYTWSENAHEFRLTPWNNDPVRDSSGEAFYIRDEERGHFWSPMPLPRRGTTPYVTRHGFGYSVFEHTERGINSEVWVYVAMDSPVKFTVLKIRNNTGRKRRLSVTGYVEWVLGDLKGKSAMHVITGIDPGSGALFAHNPYNVEFSGRVAFFDVDDLTRTVSGDRAEFIGRNGTLKNPAAMKRLRLSNKVGAALDPCAAIQVPFELADGEQREIIFRLGAGHNTADAIRLVHKYRGSITAREELETVWQYWNQTLGAVQVQTPDMSVNIMANGWLLYQTIACRLWARSGYYQSAGAFGFRDQLQDVMALIHTKPHLVREHLLKSAAHQFKEGDVQHWWHPPSGRGVRTHCSDDYLWLVMATCRYVMSTGDTGVLDESVGFIEGRDVNTDEDSYYDLPANSGVVARLYDHCVRAILKGLNFGGHGLPLIGSGDWNDGMNLVGEHGKGESVWLAFFLYDVLMQFSKVARRATDTAFADQCINEAAKLRGNIELNGWDGEWYRRAYFDDGTPLGSSENPECSIDSISQSWSVLSGAGNSSRLRMAMEALDDKLVEREHSLIRLLYPPFDKSELNPGYIKGYVPGVRENGGQYTHGAIWAGMAFAELGDSTRAWEMLNMINPINHARSADEVSTYKVEPYVVAADVYALFPHTGRGGWTWYTGSAAWMYRFIVESLLGLKLDVDKLRITPNLPAAGWETYIIRYRYRETFYRITIRQEHDSTSGMRVEVDGQGQPDKAIPLVDDRQEHRVEVIIYAASTTKAD